jgi:repressor LexA
MITELPKLNGTERIICKHLYDCKRLGNHPSLQEIADKASLSNRGSVSRYFDKLEDLGIVFRDNKHRNVSLTELGIILVESLYNIRPRGIPIIGSIAAGEPIEVFTEPETQPLILDPNLESETTYALVVRGYSMVDDCIYNGDYVVIDKIYDYKNGDIIVALQSEQGTAGKVTLKRYYFEKNQVRLQPANTKLQLEAIIIPLEKWRKEWKIEGKVKAIYRLI